MGMCKGRGACKSGSVRGMKTRERAKARGHKDVQGHGSVQGHEGMGRDRGTPGHSMGAQGCAMAAPSPCPHRSCLAARDPYCVWLPSRGCVPFSEDLP